MRRTLAPGNADLDGLRALLAEADRRGGRATLFAKAGRTGRLDAPYRLTSEVKAAFRDAAANGHEIGLHPSTFAMRHPGHLARERDRLTRAVGDLAPLVRAHYLRFDPAQAPSALEAAGFRADASLGFSATVGYRRGTGQPFRLWDLRHDRPSALWEIPLVAMDTTLLQHLGLDAEQAAAETRRVLDGARRTGGCAAILWHNRPLDEPAGREALAAYQRALDAAQADGAALLPIGAALATAVHPSRRLIGRETNQRTRSG
jgi:peptidoglycan/xylan/chitin deacetylase (PgdA/CDA1 family)